MYSDVYDFFADNPMLVLAWKVTAIKADKLQKKLKFTAHQSIRVEIVESKSGFFDVRVLRGIYKVKDEIKFREKDQENIEKKLNKIISGYVESTKKENSELSKTKYRSKNLK